LLEEAAERGFVEEKDIQSLADEHELTEDDLAGLRTALEERDVVVREETPEETRPVATAPVTGTSIRCSSSWTRRAATSCSRPRTRLRSRSASSAATSRRRRR
jgi:hypothetical protein